MSSNASPAAKSGVLIAEVENTFQFDDSLASLPVPTLDETLDRYLNSVKPLVSEDEFRETQRLVAEFGRGTGQVLQQKLVEKAMREKNWLDEWWENLAYLSVRTPIAVLGCMVGPFFSGADMWPPRPGTQLERAAVNLWVALGYYQNIRRETIPVMRNSAKDRIFSMDQLKSLFCTSRIPGEPMDQIKRYFKTEREGPCPNHVVVMCNGHIFKMNKLFDEESGEVVGSIEIHRQLSCIKSMSLSPGQGIGILTADDRTSWAKAYEHMCELDVVNHEHFETINSAIMVLTLDSESPSSFSDITLNCLCGPNGQDRWYDKSYNCISFANGMFGSTGDHSPMDGVVLAVFSYWCHMQLKLLKTKFPGSKSSPLVVTNPEEIIFTTDSLVGGAIEHATDTFQTNANNIDLVCSTYTGFGKKWIRSQGFHADAFMQIALQLTYYSMYNKFVPCYETATTRQFYHGRTETVRSTSLEMVKFCEAMVNNTTLRKTKLSLLKDAHNKHMRLMSEASEAKGCDRHLLGLYATAMESGEPIPPLFSDPSYTKSGGGGNFMLSTSLIGYAAVQGAVTAMCHDGYGCFYAIGNENYYITINCYKNCPETDAMEFFGELTRSLSTMYTLINEAKL